jgi:hypothetical protein
MVVAISFLEAPLKFRAPGVTLPIGLGIGRMVFRALNSTEAVLASAIIVSLVVGRPSVGIIVAFAVAVASLVVQILAVRPRLTRRSDAVLAGENAPRSQAHYAYVVFEVAKLIGLVIGGILLLAN